MNRQNEGAWCIGSLISNSLSSFCIYPKPLPGDFVVPLTGDGVFFLVSLMLGLAKWTAVANEIWIEVSICQLQAEALIRITFLLRLVFSKDALEVDVPGSFGSKENDKAHGKYLYPIHSLEKILAKPSQASVWSKLSNLTCNRPKARRINSCCCMTSWNSFFFTRHYYGNSPLIQIARNSIV